jgi:arsenate reductase
MKKIYFLKTCDTSRRILKYWDPADDVEIREIKENPITEKELDDLARITGSYETLFNKRAKKYKEMGMAGEKFSENEWRRSILSEYTFLKRPVLLIGDQVYAGNSKKTIEAAKLALDSNGNPG